jgi:hypothetical protein
MQGLSILLDRLLIVTKFPRPMPQSTGQCDYFTLVRRYRRLPERLNRWLVCMFPNPDAVDVMAGKNRKIRTAAVTGVT